MHIDVIPAIRRGSERRARPLVALASAALLLCTSTVLASGSTPGRAGAQAVTGARAISAASAAACYQWTRPQTPNVAGKDATLLSVSGTSANDIWAAGYTSGNGPAQTLAMHWDGKEWKVVPTPNVEGTDNYLDGVLALAPNNAWAVGDTGSEYHVGTIILHWDGNSWTQSPLPQMPYGGGGTYAIAATGPNDLWAVGVEGNARGSKSFVMHGDGNSWVVQQTPANEFSQILYSVAARGPNDVTAAGATQNSSTVVDFEIHWDGNSWQKLSLTGGMDLHMRQAYDVALAPDNVMWLVGDDGREPVIVRWQGTNGQRTGDDLKVLDLNTLSGVVALSSTEAWTVGSGRSAGSSGRNNDDEDANFKQLPIIAHTTDGANWALVQGAPITGNAELRDIAAIPGTNGNLITVGSAEGATLVEIYSDQCAAPPASPTVAATATSSATTPTAAPTFAPIPIPGQDSNSRAFPETGKTVSGIFLDYWNNNGGLAQQGYPISSMFTEVSPLNGKPYTVQYFERAVFEYHPENQPPYNVLLSQLGTFQYKQKYAKGAPNQQANNSPGSVLFPETGYRVGGKFLDYWKSHGELAQQGYPISNEFQEKSGLNGQTYTVQYFERAVFESHPENQSPYDVLLSQLGTFLYKQKYSGK